MNTNNNYKAALNFCKDNNPDIMLLQESEIQFFNKKRATPSQMKSDFNKLSYLSFTKRASSIINKYANVQYSPSCTLLKNYFKNTNAKASGNAWINSIKVNKINIINVYLPGKIHWLKRRSAIKYLRNLIKKSKAEYFILMGDFNCKTGSLQFYKNDIPLTNLDLHFNLTNITTFQRNKSTSHIDHIYCSKELIKYISSISYFHPSVYQSDHAGILLKLNIPNNPATIRFRKVRFKRKRTDILLKDIKSRPQQLDLSTIINTHSHLLKKSNKCQSTNGSAKHIENFLTRVGEDHCKQIKDTISKPNSTLWKPPKMVAKLKIKKYTLRKKLFKYTKKLHQANIYPDKLLYYKVKINILQDDIKRVVNTHHRILAVYKKEYYKNVRKKYHNAFKADPAEWHSLLKSKINYIITENPLTDFLEIPTKGGKTITTINSYIRNEAKRTFWCTLFENIKQPVQEPIQLSVIPRNKHIILNTEGDINTNLLKIINHSDKKNIKKANDFIKSLLCSSAKNNSPGPDGINSASLKCLATISPDFVNSIRLLFCNILISNKIPDIWLQQYHITLPKSGSPSISNERPIALIRAITKKFTSWLNTYLQTVIEKYKILHPWQSGFRYKRETLFNIWALSDIISLLKNQKKSYIILFMDIKKAFDSIQHLTLNMILKKRGIKSKSRNLLLQSLKGSTQFYSSADGFTNLIQLKAGVKQGDTISPTLFNLAINELLLGVEYSPKFKGIKIGSSNIKALGFADDLAFIASNTTDLINLLEIINQITNYLHLSINCSSKDKTAILTNISTLKDEYQEELKLQNQQIPILGESDTYKYLGIELNNALNFKSTNQKKIEKATKFNKITPKLPCSSYTKGIYKKLHVFSRFSYALNLTTRGLNKSKFNALIPTGLKPWGATHNITRDILYGRPEHGGFGFYTMNNLILKQHLRFYYKIKSLKKSSIHPFYKLLKNLAKAYAYTTSLDLFSYKDHNTNLPTILNKHKYKRRHLSNTFTELLAKAYWQLGKWNIMPMQNSTLNTLNIAIPATKKNKTRTISFPSIYPLLFTSPTNPQALYFANLDTAKEKLKNTWPKHLHKPKNVITKPIWLSCMKYVNNNYTEIDPNALYPKSFFSNHILVTKNSIIQDYQNYNNNFLPKFNIFSRAITVSKQITCTETQHFINDTPLDPKSEQSQITKLTLIDFKRLLFTMQECFFREKYITHLSPHYFKYFKKYAHSPIYFSAYKWINTNASFALKLFTDALFTNNRISRYIHQNVTPLCPLCNSEPDTIIHILVKCPALNNTRSTAVDTFWHAIYSKHEKEIDSWFQKQILANGNLIFPLSPDHSFIPSRIASKPPMLIPNKQFNPEEQQIAACLGILTKQSIQFLNVLTKPNGKGKKTVNSTRRVARAHSKAYIILLRTIWDKYNELTHLHND